MGEEIEKKSDSPQKEKGTLIKAIATKRPVSKGLYVDSVLIFWRDENGVKHKRFVDRAQVPYYIIKDKESPEATHPKVFIRKEKVEKCLVYSDYLYRDIATKTGCLDYFLRFGPGSYDLKNLFKHPWIYDADMDIADRYIADFNSTHDPDINYRLYKAYYDIETDCFPYGLTVNKPGMPKGFVAGKMGYIGFPDEEEAPCPITIISMMDERTMESWSFVVRNPLNKSQADFIDGIEDFEEQEKKDLEEEDGIVMKAVHVKVFDLEREAIEAFFDKMHEIDPDFALGWHCHFDILTMMNRLSKLYSSAKKELNIPDNVNGKTRMETAVCDRNCICIPRDDGGDPYYLTPYARYKSQDGAAFVDRMDEFQVLDGINWLDQMLYYANIRKQQGMKESYNLDAIATEELGKEDDGGHKGKQEFGPGETVRNLPWKNYRKFAKYNIRDVILLHLLERKNLDMDMVQRISDFTNTRKEKVFKKTISLKNFVNKYALDHGYVMSTNKNAVYGETGDEYKAEYIKSDPIIEASPEYRELYDRKDNYGAYVQDPNLDLPEGIPDANGKKSDKIFEYVFDTD